MRLNFAITLSLLFIIRYASAQGVLDGVYVKEHIPVKTFFSIYPVKLNYTFADDKDFLGIVQRKTYAEKKKVYPKFDEFELIDFSLEQMNKIILEDAIIKELERKDALTLKPDARPWKGLLPVISCGDFFERINPSKYLIGENNFAPFLKYHLKNVSVQDTNGVKFINAEVNPFLENFLTPFYFKKTEVTNAEYREFVHWVRDSIARDLLAQAGFEEFTISKMDDENQDDGLIHLNWKTKVQYNNEEYKEYLAHLYIPEERRYYRRKEIDTRKLIYSMVLNGRVIDKVQIYPDTLCWNHNFGFHIKESLKPFDNEDYSERYYPINDPKHIYDNHPKANMYFWHPAYDEFPVVGLNIEQIKAFLHWKTKMKNEKNHRKGIKYKVTYELPNEMQWELAACKTQGENKTDLRKYLTTQADHSYINNLQLKSAYELIAIEGRPLNGFIDPSYSSSINMQSVQIFTRDKINTYCEKEYKHKKYREPNGICGLSDNVSEWTSQIADSNYIKLLNARWSVLSGYRSKELNMLAEMEKMHYQQTTTGTQLIRGGNWFDDRGSEVEGKNVKCFSDPEKNYATVGFRYVMRIEGN